MTLNLRQQYEEAKAAEEALAAEKANEIKGIKKKYGKPIGELEEQRDKEIYAVENRGKKPFANLFIALTSLTLFGGYFYIFHIRPIADGAYKPTSTSALQTPIQTATLTLENILPAQTASATPDPFFLSMSSTPQPFATQNEIMPTAVIAPSDYSSCAPLEQILGPNYRSFNLQEAINRFLEGDIYALVEGKTKAFYAWRMGDYRNEGITGTIENLFTQKPEAYFTLCTTTQSNAPGPIDYLGSVSDGLNSMGNILENISQGPGVIFSIMSYASIAAFVLVQAKNTADYVKTYAVANGWARKAREVISKLNTKSPIQLTNAAMVYAQ